MQTMPMASCNQRLVVGCPYQKSRPGWRGCSDGLPSGGMLDLLRLLGGFAVGLFRLQAAREAEMAFLRQQLLVLKRSAPARLRLRIADRLIFVWLYRLFPSLLGTRAGPAAARSVP